MTFITTEDPKRRCRSGGCCALIRTLPKTVVGLNPPRGIWCHITGTDLVRDGDGQIYVLEDNLGCPSGVSYVVENPGHETDFPAAFWDVANPTG